LNEHHEPRPLEKWRWPGRAGSRDGEPETVKPKTGFRTELEKTGEPVFSREPEPVLFLIFC